MQKQPSFKIGVTLKCLGEKSCEIKGGHQEITLKSPRLWPTNDHQDVKVLVNKNK